MSSARFHHVKKSADGLLQAASMASFNGFSCPDSTRISRTYPHLIHYFSRLVDYVYQLLDTVDTMGHNVYVRQDIAAQRSATGEKDYWKKVIRARVDVEMLPTLYNIANQRGMTFSATINALLRERVYGMPPVATTDGNGSSTAAE